MFKIAIIGAGPAGVSAASRLLKATANKFHVNLIDRSLVPWGLLRTGVAPDHPEVKHTAQTWSNVSDFPNFQFFGGVNVSDSKEAGIKSELSLKELLDCHDSVLLCNGAYQARTLKIPGAESRRVINAQKLVGYYNGDVMQDWDLEPAHLQGNVGIIGGGNVALDVARVLLEPALLKPTDVSSKFLELAKDVDKISLFIRRGPFDLPCTTRELRELIHLPSVSNIVINGLTEPLGESEEYAKLMKSRKVQERKTKRLLKLLAESETHKSTFGKGKTVEFNFFHTPENISEASENILVEFSHRGETKRRDLSALVESLGYEKTPVSAFISPMSILKPGEARHSTDRSTCQAGHFVEPKESLETRRNPPGLRFKAFSMTLKMGTLKVYREKISAHWRIQTGKIGRKSTKRNFKEGKKTESSVIKSFQSQKC